MKIQNKYMQTYLDEKGKLLYYRVTFPIPKDFVINRNIQDSQYIQNIKNKWFYVRKNVNHDILEKYITYLQSEIAKWKIEQLNKRVIYKQIKLWE